MCKQGGGVLVGYLGQEGRVEGLKNEGCLGGASLGGDASRLWVLGMGFVGHHLIVIFVGRKYQIN